MLISLRCLCCRDNAATPLSPAPGTTEPSNRIYIKMKLPIYVGSGRVNWGANSGRYDLSQTMLGKRRAQDGHIWQCKNVCGSPCCHSAECGDGWFNLFMNSCTLITQCTIGVHPHPAPKSTQSDSGQVRPLKQAIIQAHSTVYFHLKNCLLRRKVESVPYRLSPDCSDPG